MDKEIQPFKKKPSDSIFKIKDLKELLDNVKNQEDLQNFEIELNMLSKDIGKEQDATIKREYDNLQRIYRFAKRSIYVKNIEPELEQEPMSMGDYAYLTSYADNMIEQIQKKKTEEEIKQSIVTPYTGSHTPYENEIDEYMSITKGRGLHKNTYSQNTKTKIKTAISFFRNINAIWSGSADKYQQKIINSILSYQSDPDWSDVLQASFLQRREWRMNNNYHGYRLFSIKDDHTGNISIELLTKLKDTALADQIIELMSDPDDTFIVGYNRLYNILFEFIGNLFLMAFVFQHWPTFTYPEKGCFWDEYGSVQEESAFAVYIGTGPLQSDYANVVNFQLNDIINGIIQPGETIRLFAPVTSSSNDAEVAWGFADEVIIKIYCINVKPYMCVAKTANEAETFILAGDYQFLTFYQTSINGKDITVFEFLQMSTDFNGISPDNIDQAQIDIIKGNIDKEIKDAFPSFNPDDDDQPSQDVKGMDDIFGGLNKRKTKKRRRRLTKKRKNNNKRRRTNKRYKRNKRKI